MPDAKYQFIRSQIFNSGRKHDPTSHPSRKNQDLNLENHSLRYPLLKLSQSCENIGPEVSEQETRINPKKRDALDQHVLRRKF
ncbi:hypothetical protein MJO28_012981 [Puccinia striiformis f. sp. tritici]|uniref:Uncharacterized protein n=1 Tax=Puccinia striiformis f. sp. tritici TaxID=168172 RepID=A0ACC0DXG5_9BASI|nr:hypothetical protein MJO28_012981 [Puccinia striiformis f. sp. tritici]